jgi:hypothetical protein
MQHDSTLRFILMISIKAVYMLLMIHIILCLPTVLTCNILSSSQQHCPEQYVAYAHLCANKPVPYVVLVAIIDEFGLFNIQFLVDAAI